MKKNLLILILLSLFFASCGNTRKDEKASITEKKVKLEKLRTEQKELSEKIAALEAEVAAADPLAAASAAKLVSVMPLNAQEFTHFIELQGKIDADNISYVSPRGGPGQVKAVYVKKGDAVRKGQLLLKLDDAMVRSQIAQVQSQLAYARDLYNRQQNLWKQDIGTEVQVLTAKNNVAALERQIATLNEQLALSNVYAQVPGIADEVNIRVGEIFTGSPMQGIKIVNTSNLKITANIPENYATRVRKGTPVEIVVPDLNNRRITSAISLISQSIDPNTRGFIAEARIPADANLKPNQLAKLKILDYTNKEVVTVPVNVVQTDENGKYVYVAERSGEKLIARKKSINIGEAYGGMIEVKAGLQPTDQLITEGYQNLYEGQLVAIAKK